MIAIDWNIKEGIMNEEALHISVMPDEVIEYLNLFPGGCALDCTLGLGGHASSIVKKIGVQGHFIGIDRDQDSLNRARQKLSTFEGKCDLKQEDFRNFDKTLKELGVKGVDGMLFDLGISSFQLNNPGRGFSFQCDGPLDMRMDQEGFISAYDLVNSLPEKDLAMILRNFGEERFHQRIARRIVERRKQDPIETTQQLIEEIFKALPRHYSRQKIHPATRTFQALRIAVNRELEALSMALDKAVDYLNPKGRIVVIAFHSLEDRIVKEKFRYFVNNEKLKILTKKPVRPGDEEISQNSRARSARLRAAERIL